MSGDSHDSSAAAKASSMCVVPYSWLMALVSGTMPDGAQPGMKDLMVALPTPCRAASQACTQDSQITENEGKHSTHEQNAIPCRTASQDCNNDSQITENKSNYSAHGQKAASLSQRRRSRKESARC